MHRIMIRVLARPFVWAHHQQHQTIITRTIRAAWRAL